ncbi:MAG: response regulator [Pseudobdellovibrio sp.]
MKFNEINILIVEDDGDLREILSIFVKKIGLNVFSVANGKEALDCLKENKIDLVFSDIQMPIMSGIDLLKAIKSDSENKTLVLLTTGHAIFTQKDVIEMGALGLVSKPFSFDLFSDLIKEIINKNFNK